MASRRNTTLLLEEYCLRKDAILARLESFKKLNTLSEKQLFEELAFCLFTPGSKALNANKAVNELKRKRLLYNGSKESIARSLRGIIRFHNNKASYLVYARRLFRPGKGFNIKKILLADTPFVKRQWLVDNVKGLGLKEASHFLRNIGLGQDIAILDTHILKNLKKFNILKKIPLSLSKKAYLDTEIRMKEFSKDINIPIDALDLLFWSRETGFIYK